MTKLSAFNWKDLFTFGMVAILFTAGALYVTIAPSPDKSPTALALFWVVAATGWLIYVALVRARGALLARFGLVTSHGLRVALGDYRTTPEVDAATIEAETVRAISKFKLIYPNDNAEALLKQEWTWVEFVKGTSADHKSIERGGRKVAGYTLYGGEGIVVVWSDKYEPLSNTAFAHELVHVMLGRLTGNWDESFHHEMMAKAGI